MRPETGTEASGVRHDPKRGNKGVRTLLFPSRERLHPWARLGLAALLNVALATWVVPKLGHAADPTYSPFNALSACLEVLLPCTALIIVVPVFLSGRDVPRLLAIGLAFLPGYVAIAGLCDAFSLWSSGR